MAATATTATATQTLSTITPEIHKVPPITGWTNIWGVEVNPSLIVFMLVVVTVSYFLWQGQRQSGKNTFDVWDLLMDRVPDGCRRASGIKTAYQFSFLLSSWVVVDNQMKGTLTEGIFGLYLATWCASLIAKVVFDKKDPPQIPGRGKDHDDDDKGKDHADDKGK